MKKVLFLLSLVIFLSVCYSNFAEKKKPVENGKSVKTPFYFSNPEIIKKWKKQSEPIEVGLKLYCQAVTPPRGISIGQVLNPDYTGKSIPGGQFKYCTVYLTELEDNDKD